jgi:hypothetical protein
MREAGVVTKEFVKGLGTSAHCSTASLARGAQKIWRARASTLRIEVGWESPSAEDDRRSCVPRLEWPSEYADGGKTLGKDLDAGVFDGDNGPRGW